VALVELGQSGYTAGIGGDVTNFANCYGITLGAGQLTPTPVDGATNTPGPDTIETELDIETVLSLAPKANIDVYEGASSMYDVFSRIVSDDTAKIVSASWTNGCEAYVPRSFQNSENTLFQAAAAEGQSIFVASGDQGSQGCNINGVTAANTGGDPVAQAVDPSTGTLYIANKSSNSVSVDSEGGTNALGASTASSTPTGAGSGPDAVALDPSIGRVFVANSNSTLTVLSTNTCNRSTTSGCGSPTQISSGGHLSAPAALAANGSTLYVGNSNGTVAVYSVSPSATTWVATVNLPGPLLLTPTPTAIAVDSTHGTVYVADSTYHSVEYFNAATCNASNTSGCSVLPQSVSVGQDPVALAVASGAGYLYVANAGIGGGISVVSLSTQTVFATISTNQPPQSIVLSPDNREVLAVLVGFPGDVMATINTSTQTIASTVGLENGSDAMGQLVSDGTLGYAWVTDTTGGDIVQNLNLAVTDPGSQPYVTAVGGTSVTALGPVPTETVWNELNHSEGAAGGGISQSFSMPAYQQTLGNVSGSSGVPCTNPSGNCREVPDVSADADPSTGYIVYDSHDFGSTHWAAVGGTSGATPLWAAVLAVVASANGNTVGYGALNPALYLLAQKSPSTYLNDVTSGNNDYNATNGGQFPALSGYDMASGLGTPIASELASGLTGIPLDVAVSGSQRYGGSPTFSGSANYAGSGGPPYGVTVNANGITCNAVGASTSISPTLTVGSYTLASMACGGAMLTGANAADYSVFYTSAPGDFVVNPARLTVTATSGTIAYGSNPPTISPLYTGFVNQDNASSLTTLPTCSTTATNASRPSPPPYPSTCSGASDSNYTISYVPGSVTVLAPTPPPPAPPTFGYWLVGSDGGIFTFGSAQFYGSTGSLRLQRPVVGIVPTGDHNGYWLDASDGGVFSYGDTQFYGSIPGTGLNPAGSGLPHSLNAPIVGMVPSSDGGGYFMVASDGGVFAFGDARFEGSCPGMGGCSGAAVAVVPDASGNGYWLVTQTGNVYAFGDAPSYGAPGSQGSPVTSAVRTADGRGYWVLLADGAVYAYGDAVSRGGPAGSVGGFDPATAIFSDATGGGYWVASAAGAVFSYGDAPNDGSMVGNHLNGSIIAATGF
jgi:DNA-binding beta-propeller fold protein YncE